MIVKRQQDPPHRHASQRSCHGRCPLKVPFTCPYPPSPEEKEEKVDEGTHSVKQRCLSGAAASGCSRRTLLQTCCAITHDDNMESHSGCSSLLRSSEEPLLSELNGAHSRAARKEIAVCSRSWLQTSGLIHQRAHAMKKASWRKLASYGKATNSARLPLILPQPCPTDRARTTISKPALGYLLG